MTAAADTVSESAPGAARGLAKAAGVLGVVVVAFAVGGLFMLASGHDPFAAYATMLGYALGTKNGFAEVLVRAIPLTLTGLGVAVAFRAKLFNVGADGQIMIGGITAVALVTLVPGLPGWAMAAVFLITGFVGGGLYGGIAGWLRARYNANEIIVTIMLNYIALQILAWVVRGPLQETMGIFPRSDSIPGAAVLDVIVADSRVHAGLILALVATVVVALVMRYSVFGFALRLVGANPEAARFGGVGDRFTIFAAMALSGALAGLAGAVEVAGIHHRLQDNFAPGFGVAAIAVALLSRLNPIAVPLAALLFGVLHVGSGVLQRESGIPIPIVWIVEGAVILGFLVFDYLRIRGARG
jgi:simple sugar transport system permease protein